MSASHAGKLLVATPAITDPNFHRTVVLLCTHDEEGAFGLVINRPIDGAKVVDHVPQWSEHAATPAVMFRGGPVEPSAGFALGRVDRLPEGVPWSPVLESLALLNLNGTPEDLAGCLVECRLFAGYSGWSPGQLEGEIEGGGWFVVDAEPGDPFAANPGGLWRAVLARQTGETRLYSYFPLDPRVN